MSRYSTAAAKALIGFVAGVFVFFAIQLLWWQLFPYRTAEIVVPMTVLNENKEVPRDDKLRLEVTFTKYTPVEPKVSRNIYCLDGSVSFPISRPVTGTARPVGTFTARPEYGISDSTPSDVLCFFEFTNPYKVNPIRTIIKTWRSESFVIRE